MGDVRPRCRYCCFRFWPQAQEDLITGSNPLKPRKLVSGVLLSAVETRCPSDGLGLICSHDGGSRRHGRDNFSRIHASRTADDVVHQIESLILEGVLRGGDRLRANGSLHASSIFPSYSTRCPEAARKCWPSHIATRWRHICGRCHWAGFQCARGEAFTDHRKAKADYLEYRREIEGIAAEFAALRATPADKALLKEIILAMETAHGAGDFDTEARLDVDFHNAIGEAAHNIVLLHIALLLSAAERRGFTIVA